jgi:glutamyl/glutaminyl-tRNA synthetase
MPATDDLPAASNFVRDLVVADNERARSVAGSRPASRRNRTATCTSATPRRSPSTSASPPSSAGLQPALRRHQPRHRGHELRRRNHRRPRLARLSDRRRAALRQRLLRAALRLGRAADHQGSRLRRRPGRRDDLGPAGRLRQPGVESPFRDRPIEENLDLFRRMRAGEFAEGSHVLRAKIDMQHENMQLRDPVMYRIRGVHHHRTGALWSIYPTYDWAHGQSDAIEGVTHSLCTLEFDSHRALYDWYLEQLPLPFEQPRQTEFARLELTHTVTSKRGSQARRGRHRRRVGRPADADAARTAAPRLPGVGDPRVLRLHRVSRTNSRHQIELLESFVRTELNRVALRRMAVLRPLRVVITNWPSTRRASRSSSSSSSTTTRRTPTTAPGRCRSAGAVHRAGRLQGRAAAEVLPLSPGKEVRLRGAYFVTATGIRHRRRRQRRRGAGHLRPRDAGRQRPRRSQGQVDDALGVGRPRDRCHGGAVRPAVRAEVPGEATGDPLDDLNPDSRELLLTGAKVEPGGAAARLLADVHRPATWCSSSGSATSPPTRCWTDARSRSTAPSASATSGPTSRSARTAGPRSADPHLRDPRRLHRCGRQPDRRQRRTARAS